MDKALEEIRAIQQASEEQLEASLASARRQVENESQELAQSIIQQFQPRRTAS
jgi:F0F1-type ATP synthase membrane subunit b/b'